MPEAPWDWQAMMMLSRPERMEAILRAFESGTLTPAHANALLAEWWSNIEFPLWHGQRRLVRLFKHAGFVTDMEGVTAPAAPLTVYRGCRIDYDRGLSWTTDEAVAAWFARRYSLRAAQEAQHYFVFVTTIEPRHVLGIFHEMGESEVIVNPHGLRGKLGPGSATPADDDCVRRLAEHHTEVMRQRKERSFAARREDE